MFPKKVTLQNGEHFGLIDIGSSCLRLVVYRLEHGYPHILINQRVWTALAKEKSAENFKITEAEILSLKTGLRQFYTVCSNAKCTHVMCFATSALREAINGVDVAQYLSEETGIDVVIIDGQREAELAAFGGYMSVPHAKGMVMDLGGGSLDICASDDQTKSYTFPLGVLRLKTLSANSAEKAKSIVEQSLILEKKFSKNAKGALVILGSGMKTLAQLHMQNVSYPMKITQSYTVNSQEMKAFCQQIVEGNILEGFQGLFSKYKDILPYRAAALLAVLEQGDFQSVVFANYGIREGVLLKALAFDIHNFDPLCLFAEGMAQRDGHGASYAGKMSLILEKLFPDIPARYLRTAACFSHICWREHSAQRAHRAFDAVYWAPYVGCDHRHRAWLALSAYFSYTSEIDESLLEMCPQTLTLEDLRQAESLGHVIRKIRTCDPALTGDFSDLERYSSLI